MKHKRATIRSPKPLEPTRTVSITLELPDVVCPTDLVTILNRARKKAKKAGRSEEFEVLGKLLFLAHPSFHQMDEFPLRVDEGMMTEVQINEIRRRLRPLVGHYEDVRRWLNTPQPVFNDKRPVECSYSEVKRVVLQMRNEALAGQHAVGI